ncbi:MULTISPECIES: hypothetical protein [Streptomyces]|nr:MULTISPECIES: hypothetical protein [Streptomyces]MCP9956177.1 hypothetical protein [Streptomyces sudanensis]
MKPVRAVVVAAPRMTTVGAAVGTAAADTGGAGTRAASSAAPGDDSGWG